MADVCLRGDLEYDRPLLREKLGEMILAVGDWPAAIGPGARVLIKVNMLSPKGPEMAITTHPELVAAIAELLLERGCEVAIGDSPGGAIKGVEQYWRNCGFERIARELGCELVNFEASGSVARTVGGFTYRITRVLDEFDAVINACKLKTHLLCRVTNGIKNAFGIVPGLGKSVIHSYAPGPRDLAEQVVNVYGLVRFDLTIMDAILAMDGRGPSTDGRPRHEGLLGVARDSVVLDMVISDLLGLGPEGLDITRAARRRGLGKPWEKVTVDGDHRFVEFDVPRTAIYNLVPPLVGDLLRPLWKKVPQTGGDCTACGLCERSCPVGAIEMQTGRARMDRGRCVLCLCCHELCPENAIVFRSRLDRLRRRG